MGKPCNAEGCYQPRWGGGFCRSHQWKRTDKKPLFLKRKPTSKMETDFGFDNQIELFGWLWNEARDRNGIVVCPYTGERLNRFYDTDMWFNCFAHVLNKKNWPYFKLNPENVEVVFPDFHTLADQGKSSDKAKHPLWNFSKWNEKVFEMKEKYTQFKKKNLLA